LGRRIKNLNGYAKFMKNLFKCAGWIQSIKTLVDGGLSLNIHTQELDPENELKIFQLRKKTGYFVFAEQSSDITENEFTDLPEVHTDYKTPSQRLRGCIYRVWEKSGSTKPFEEYYIIYMEKLIQGVKEKLD
jgi:hypothetical protein